LAYHVIDAVENSELELCRAGDIVDLDWMGCIFFSQAVQAEEHQCILQDF
jgi:hypothetical protein